VFYVVFLRDVACQKLLKSANVSRSYSRNNTGTVFFETRCIFKNYAIGVTKKIVKLLVANFLVNFCPSLL